MSDCEEPYRACVATRSSRIEQTIEENPDLSNRRIAEIVGCDEKAVRNHRKKLEDVSSTKDPVELEPYIPEQPWEDQPEIKALHKALYRCSPEQRGYIWKHVLPFYDPGNQYKRNIP